MNRLTHDVSAAFLLCWIENLNLMIHLQLKHRKPFFAYQSKQPMSPEEKQLVKEKLEKELVKTKIRIAELKELTKPVEPDCAIGRISRMDAINNKSVNEAALRKTEEKLSKIKHALDVIDKPEFGNCEKCGEPIQLGRLVVMPGSVHCIRCSRR